VNNGPHRLARRQKALVWATLFCFLWAVIDELGAYASISLYQIVWTCYAVHLVVLGLAMWPVGLGVLLETKRRGLQIGCSLLMLGMPLGFITAVRSSSVESVHTLFWIAPILTLLVCSFAGERVGWKLWLIGFCGWIGVLFLQGIGLPRTVAGMAGGILMALCFCLYLIGMHRLATESTASKLFHTALFVFIPLTFGLPRFYTTPDAGSVVAMSGIGLVGLAALFALDTALELAPAAIVAPMMLTQPVFAPAGKTLRGGIANGPGILIGLAFQLCAVILLVLFVRTSAAKG
jgi:drug/metabolite transporter (DMT)-like permease